MVKGAINTCANNWGYMSAILRHINVVTNQLWTPHNKAICKKKIAKILIFFVCLTPLFFKIWMSNLIVEKDSDLGLTILILQKRGVPAFCHPPLE